MQNKNAKRLVSILICLAMVLVVLPMAVFADGTYTVAGEAGLCGVAWDPAQNVMTGNGDGTYSITFNNVAAGTYQYKIADGSWANSWGDGGYNGGNMKVTVTTACAVTITFDPATETITATGSGVGEVADMEINYMTAVGAGAGGFLNDVSWDPAAASNKMTQNGKVYTISYANVAAGTYEFKFASNGTWSDSWGTGAAVESGVPADAGYNGGNSSVTVAEDGTTVTLTLDLSNMDYKTGNGAVVTVTVGAAPVIPTDPTDPSEGTEPSEPSESSEPTEPDETLPLDPGGSDEPIVPVEVYYVAGDSALCGSNWDEDDDANLMALNEAGLYQKTFTNVAAGTYALKVTDGTWTNSWGGDGENGNYVVTLEATGDVIVTFDSETQTVSVEIVAAGEAPADPEPEQPGEPEDPAEPEGPADPENPADPETPDEETPETPTTGELSEYFVAGSEALCGSNWDPSDVNNQMYIGTDGLCYMTYSNVPAGSYELKITKGSWSENWGVGGPDGANVAFTLDATEDITVVFNPATGEITVLKGNESIPESGDLGLTAVAVALLAATAGVVAIVKKKEF